MKEIITFVMSIMTTAALLTGILLTAFMPLIIACDHHNHYFLALYLVWRLPMRIVLALSQAVATIADQLFRGK